MQVVASKIKLAFRSWAIGLIMPETKGFQLVENFRYLRRVRVLLAHMVLEEQLYKQLGVEHLHVKNLSYLLPYLVVFGRGFVIFLQ